MRQLIVPIGIGLAGMAILIGLGVWQMQRLTWKQDLLAAIEARIAAPPVELPATGDPERDQYLPVRAEGIASIGVRVLMSVKLYGAGYRMISVFETGGRRVLLDRGYLRLEEHTDAGGPQPVTVVGNLHWPDEVDGFTPDPDLEKGLWFARDVPRLAEVLGTEPILIVAREITPAIFSTRPLPVGAGGIPNDHLQYAITWFSLAAVWAGMTALWVSRIRRRRM